MNASQTGTEDRLRSAFADAASTVRENELRHHAPPAPHRRLTGSRRGRLLVSAAAALAVLVVVIAAVTVPRVLHAGSRGPAPSMPAESGPTAYVVMSADSSPGPSPTAVVRISLRTGAVLMPDIRLPEGLVENSMITPDGKVFCVQTLSKVTYLTCINTRTGAAGRPVAVTPGALLQAITPNGRAAYLLQQPVTPVNRKLPAIPGGVLPVNLVTGTAGRLIRDPGVQQLAMSPNGRTLYAASQPPSRNATSSGPLDIVPIDTATNTALHPVEVPTQGLEDGIVVSPDGKIVYVLTDSAKANGSAAVTPISAASDVAMKPIPISLPDAGNLGIAPDGRTAWVSDSTQNLVLIDLRQHRALTPSRLPDKFVCVRITATGCNATWAWTLQFAPDSRTAYIYGPGATVIPVDVATDTLQAPITVAPHPYNQLAWPPAEIGLRAGNLYAGVDYYTRLASGHDQWHGGLSEVDLATGTVKLIKIGLAGLEPASVFLTP